MKQIGEVLTGRKVMHPNNFQCIKYSMILNCVSTYGTLVCAYFAIFMKN